MHAILLKNKQRLNPRVFVLPLGHYTNWYRKSQANFLSPKFFEPIRRKIQARLPGTQPRKLQALSCDHNDTDQPFNLVPHSEQNAEPGMFKCPQLGHLIFLETGGRWIGGSTMRVTPGGRPLLLDLCFAFAPACGGSACPSFATKPFHAIRID